MTCVGRNISVMGNGTAKNFDKATPCAGGCDNSGETVSKIMHQASQQWKRDKSEVLLTELKLAKGQLREKEIENDKLKAEIHKLKSVIDVKIHKNGKPDLLASLHEEPGVVGHEIRNKKQGVSGESSSLSGLSSKIGLLQHFDKDFRSKQLIKDAILENDFLKQLDSIQIREVVDCMYEQKIKKGQFVIREGQAGQHLYVSAEGDLEVSKEGEALGVLNSGRAFGELAILYNCTRTASVLATQDGSIWVLDRRVFQAIMMKTSLERQQEKIHFLQSVPLLKDLSKEKLAKISDVLEVDFFHGGEYIVREGATGNTFFLINKGEVKITQSVQDRAIPQEVRTLERGDYFGEKALLSEDRRTANVIAEEPGVECLTVDRDAFIKLIGALSELREKDYGDEQRGAQRLKPSNSLDQDLKTQEEYTSSSSLSESQMPNVERVGEYADVMLEDLDIIGTLGMGGFGRVEMVQLANHRSKTFALKCLKKQHIVETRQQEHVYSERKIMMQMRSPFIARLYKTFRDRKYVYMLMEVCLGGELWTILRDRGNFDDQTTRFYTACVVEAYQYLHSRGIIYRDLKPENLLLDCNGYVKLVDFGFAKRIGYGKKTWTFCGTPEYVAPEIILNRGHDYAADYWSLGILMYELLTGSPPFSTSDPMNTYNYILKGIDIIPFPRNIGRHANNLIKKLCRESPAERLGYGKKGISEIHTHKWFQGFDWEGLRKQTIIPPIIPKVKGPVDISNFDKYPKEMHIPADETSGWDVDF